MFFDFFFASIRYLVVIGYVAIIPQLLSIKKKKNHVAMYLREGARFRVVRIVPTKNMI